MANYGSGRSLDDVFHALSDATRRSVLSRLSTGPATVTDLAKPFDMALPSFLKHVRLLEHSGWIETQKTGRVRSCRIRPETLAGAQRWLQVQHEVWVARTNRLEQFVVGETLTPKRRRSKA